MVWASELTSVDADKCRSRRGNTQTSDQADDDCLRRSFKEILPRLRIRATKLLYYRTYLGNRYVPSYHCIPPFSLHSFARYPDKPLAHNDVSWVRNKKNNLEGKPEGSRDADHMKRWMLSIHEETKGA
jgi:hypothetical protein